MTRQQAIRARCLDCSGNMADARNCIFTSCPLYPYRINGNGSRGSRKTAIMKFCLECCDGSAHERTLCPVEGCSLHQYRNTKAVRDSRDDEKPL